MSSDGGAPAATMQPTSILVLEDSRFDVELLTEALAQTLPLATIRAVRDERGFVEALNEGGLSVSLSKSAKDGGTMKKIFFHTSY